VEYITESGQSPVLDFLFDLQRYEPYCYAKYLYVKDLLQQHGTIINSTHWTYVGGGYGEIRWRTGRKRMRVYCSEENPQAVVMYEGTIKKWMAMSNADKELARKRRQDYQSSTYDQEARHLRYLAKRKGHA